MEERKKKWERIKETRKTKPNFDLRSNVLNLNVFKVDNCKNVVGIIPESKFLAIDGGIVSFKVKQLGMSCVDVGYHTGRPNKKSALPDQYCNIDLHKLIVSIVSTWPSCDGILPTNSFRPISEAKRSSWGWDKAHFIPKRTEEQHTTPLTQIQIFQIR